MSERQLRPNRPRFLGGRTAMFTITIAAVLGLGAGSSLAEATDEPVPASTQPADAEQLIIELVVEPPPADVPAEQPAEEPAEQPAEQPAAEPDPSDAEPAESPATVPTDPVTPGSTDDDPTGPADDGTTESDGAVVVELVVELDTAAPPPGNGPSADPAPDATTESTPEPAATPAADEPAAPADQEVEASWMETTTSEPTAEQQDEPHGDEPHGDEPDEGHEGGHEGSSGGHEGGHEGGSGQHGSGQGNPYYMTFTVDWRFDDGAPIQVLEGVLPLDWRTIFELAAASQTGSGRPTAARCTYADTTNEMLVCEFDNPPHRSDTAGMVVPARPTATYTVTVDWDVKGWTIAGADDDGPFSARELCPRGGGGHDGDHGDGHDGGTDHAHLDDGHDGHDGGSGGGNMGY